MAEYDDTKVKDNMVVAISGAIKSLQLYSISSKDRSKDTPKVISNNNLQLHDLCIQLDRAFCHGNTYLTLSCIISLRAGKNGFWKYLHGVIPKKTVQEIEGLANVSSDIGKGRAWLHLILAESSLESYLRLFAKQNDIHKRKHYHRYALLCDIERMQLLETVASGLDAIQFVLDMDVPYMDSVDYSTPFVSGNVNNDDKLSNTPGFAKKKVLTSMGYVDCVVKSSESKSAVMSPANDNISPNAEVKKDKTAPEKLPQKEHPRLSSAPIPPMLQASITSSEHMADTVVSRNRKKKKNKSSKGTSQSSHDKSAKSHGDVITDDKIPTDVLDDKYLSTEENKNDFHAKEAPMDPVDSTSVTSKGELITKPSELLQTE
ncbi:uncharacterized protein TRIADDRAFT_64028 [Trichoplax adhaerens]|uniref:RUN domain-containing protein n=1 Tax=Trichoplax adhaerens TaxID=10228 RepID=B3RZY2_TRIAD|nr:hypothetical protein TRIADDRAFT_64028 [Trichoplax adhaerens]EDV23911.1 hypothetical protein TRIADDRAFT_64028 [Trichoplax adhaerens]|eukprot:XP_002113437.1 hypothetical protein TRIADDRAFT_64028 [Trichoplax adhaerens]